MANDAVDIDEYAVRIRTHGETLESGLSKAIEGFMRTMMSDSMKRKAASIYMKCVEKYVPMDNGDLRASAHVSTGKYKGDYVVLYGNDDVKYAKVQYEGDNGRIIKGKDSNGNPIYGEHKKPGSMWSRNTKGTYDHWNKHMTTADRAEYMSKVKAEMLKRLKDGQK